jgi:hypothetical protein
MTRLAGGVVWLIAGMRSRRAVVSAEPLTKLDQFRNFNLEHGFGAAVSAKDAKLSF